MRKSFTRFVLAHPRQLIFASLVATLAPAAFATGPFHFEPVAILGDAAPGTEAGTVFGPTPNGYVIVVPTIDDDGRLAFPAMLQGPSIGSSNHSGLWAGVPGAIALVARAGAQAPGLATGVRYQGFPFDFALIAPQLGSNRLAFTATLTGPGIDPDNDDVIYSGSAGSLNLLAREGVDAPGVPAGVHFTTMALHMSENGHALVQGTVHGPGVTTETNEGFWTDRTGTLTLLFREGDPAPDTAPGVVFGGAGQFIGTGYSFLGVQWNNVSEEGLQGNVTGPGVDTFNNEALYIEQNGQLQLLAREGDDVPGVGPNVDFGANSVTAQFGTIAFNELGHAAFDARIGGGSVTTTHALFSNHTGTLDLVGMPFDPAPGTSDQFGLVFDPHLSSAGRLAFRASLAGAGSYPPFGVWWDQTGALGSYSPLVLPGQAVTDRAGVTIVSVTWMRGFNAAGKLVLQADLADGVSSANPAIVMADPSGALRVVVAQGDLVDARGNGTEYRQVSRFDFGRLNEAGQMSLRLEFTDGSFGFYRVSPDGPVDAGSPSVTSSRLVRVSPNPFGSQTRLEYDIARPGRASVNVFDVSGRLVAQLANGPHTASRHSLIWNGRDRFGAETPAGVYWVRIQTQDGPSSLRVVRAHSR